MNHTLRPARNPALAALLEQAELERDAALARMLQADDAVRHARAQAEQLQAYREDYRRRAPALDGRSASIELVRCHQGFMQRLEQAIVQQREQLARLEQSTVALREALLEREVRVAAVKKLAERRGREVQRQALRTEQRHTDEAAQRLLAQRQPMGSRPDTALVAGSAPLDEALPSRHRPAPPPGPARRH